MCSRDASNTLRQGARLRADLEDICTAPKKTSMLEARLGDSFSRSSFKFARIYSGESGYALA